MPADGRGSLELVTGLSLFLGGGPIDPDGACRQILGAASKGNHQASMIYRRLSEALSSMCSLAYTDINVQMSDSSLGIQDIDPQLFHQLELLETVFADNYLAQVMRFIEQCSCCRAVHKLVCKRDGPDPDEANIDFLRFSNPAYSSTFRNEKVDTFVEVHVEYFRDRVDSSPALPTNEELELLRILLPATILFGEESLPHLSTLWEYMRRLDIRSSFDMRFDLNGRYVDSPLILACRVGNAAAVRILCCGRDTNKTCQLVQRRDADNNLPIHFLFTFQDADAADVCRILRDGLVPEDLTNASFLPLAELSIFFGGPLDYSLKAGSLAATAALWEQVYQDRPAFMDTMGHVPGHLTQSFLEEWIDLSAVADSPLEVAIIRFYASMNPKIWKYFLTTLDKGDGPPLCLSAASPSLADVDEDKKERLFSTALTHSNFLILPLMLTHGQSYAKQLSSHFFAGIGFFTVKNVDVYISSITNLLSAVDFSIQVTMMEPLSCLQSLEETLSTSMSNPLTTDGVPAPTTPRGTLVDSYRHFVYSTCIKAAESKGSLGHMLGFIMPPRLPPYELMRGLAAAALFDDIPAFRRILYYAEKNETDMEGGVGYLAREFATKKHPGAQKYLKILRDGSKTFLNTSWYLPRFLFSPQGIEISYTEIGQAIGDAVKHSKKDLVLGLIEGSPSLLTPSFWHAGLFYLLCVNDDHAELLEDILDELDPAQTLQALRQRDRFSGLYAPDVAVYYGSLQCTHRLGNFLAKQGLSWADVYPVDPDSLPFWGTLHVLVSGLWTFTTMKTWVNRILGRAPPKSSVATLCTAIKEYGAVVCLHAGYDQYPEESKRAELKAVAER